MLNAAELHQAFEEPVGSIVEFLRFVTAQGELPESIRALDMGCGPGRLLAPLVELGWVVDGVEPDPDYYAGAKRIADTLPGAHVRQGRFEDLEALAAYDIILAIDAVFSCLITPHARQAALRRAFQALRPSGLLVLDLPNFPWILNHYRAPSPQNAHVGALRVRLVRATQIDRLGGVFTTTLTYYVGPNAETLEPVRTQIRPYAMVP